MSPKQKFADSDHFPTVVGIIVAFFIVGSVVVCSVIDENAKQSTKDITVQQPAVSSKWANLATQIWSGLALSAMVSILIDNYRTNKLIKENGNRYNQLSDLLVNHIQGNSDLVRLLYIQTSENPGDQAVQIWTEVLHRFDASFLAASNVSPSIYEKSEMNKNYYSLALEEQKLKRKKNPNKEIKRIFFAHTPDELIQLKVTVDANKSHGVTTKCIKFENISSSDHNNRIKTFLSKCKSGEFTLDFIVVRYDVAPFVIAFYLDAGRENIVNVKIEFRSNIVGEYVNFHEYSMGNSLTDDHIT